MKKIFLFTVLLLLSAGWAFGCGPQGPDYDAYVFRLCLSPQSYSDNNDQRIADAWSALIGKKVTVAQSRQLADVTLAELDTLNNPIAKYARGSKEVSAYLRLLVKYLENSQVTANSWNYPGPEELAQYQANLKAMLAEAAGYQGKLLYDRYYLLRLRILFRQGEYQSIINMWEHSPLKGEGVFVDMSRDYYAGALYHVGRQTDAAVQYALSGNMFDAHQCMRYLHGAQCLASVVKADPNSPVLPYMLEELVNGCRESFDYYRNVELMRPYVEHCMPWLKMQELRVPYDCIDYEGCGDGEYRLSELPSLGKWFGMVHAYQVSREEYSIIDQVIEQQSSDKSVTDRCMWLSAKAYLLYLKGDYDKAWKTIQQAVKSSGSQASELNARYLLMLLSTRQSSLKVMENTLAKGLPEFLVPEEYSWSHTSADGSYTYYDYENRVVSNSSCLNHLVKYGIVDRYLRQGDSVMATMAWSLLCNRYEDYYSYLPSSGDEHYWMFSKLGIANKQALLAKIESPAAKQGVLLQLICGRLPFDKYDYYDVMGTHLLCDGRFEEALPYLTKVPLSFISRQPIAPYAAVRSFRDTPWEKKIVDNFGDMNLTTNAKVDYCREVLRLRQQLATATGEARCEAAYQLGALYHQASAMGNCWWLAYYGVSTIYDYNLTLSDGHFDFHTASREMLKDALASTNTDLRYKAYYLLIHQGHNGLYYGKWSNDYSDYSYVLDATSPYYPLLRQFKNDLYVKKGMPAYVSHCDDLVEMFKLLK